MRDQARRVAGDGRGGAALLGAAGGLRGRRDAAAPSSAAEVTARELVQALDQGGAASTVADTDGGTGVSGVLADPAAARAAMVDAAEAVHATRNAGESSAGATRVQDAAAAQRAAIMAAAGKAAHEERIGAAAGGSSSKSSSRGAEHSSDSELDIGSLQRAAAVRLGGSEASDIGSVFGSSGSGQDSTRAGGLGNGASGQEGSDAFGSTGGSDATTGNAHEGAADPLQALEAVLSSRADPALVRVGAGGIARE